MSDERPVDEPSADDVEALVRAIAAKEAGAAVPDAVAPPGPDHPTSDGIDPAPPRPVIVVSEPRSARRPAGEPIQAGETPAPDRRNRARPLSSRAVARPRTSPPPVTGLVGRVEWDRLVADESERQRRYGRPSAIVLIEVEGLDRATAQAGPSVVGRVISPCGATLVAAARASDRVTRLGDGRFGVLLREADADGASRYAKRAVAACDPWLAALPWPLRLSVGWASPDGGDDLLAAFRQAERRLEASATGG
jgi:GGDEF domain-containing protein